MTERTAIRRFDLPERGGVMTALDLGPQDRPIDVLFAHANGFNARTYASILAPLAAELRILAIDQRGHGGTELPTGVAERANWFDLRDDLLALLIAADIRDVVLAGHSMGATVNLLAAAEAPERVCAVTLFEPVILARGRSGEDPESPIVQSAVRRRRTFGSRREAFEAYVGRGAFKRWPPQILADYIEDGFQDAPGGGVQLACSPDWEVSNFLAQRQDPREALLNTPLPIRILRADRGSTCDIADDIPQLTAAGHVRVETIADTTHFLPMERPDLVQNVLREAVAGLGS
jgi:pimeloyl-ACP methyl ester carboxylesterase